MSVLTNPQTKNDVQVKPAKKPAARRFATKRWVLLLLAVVALVGGYFAWNGYASPATKTELAADIQTYKARRAPLLVTVNEDGNVESASNIDLKCEVEGGSQILWIIPEGTEVEAGTELVRLDSSLIREEITQQTIAFERAQADLIKAEQDHSVATIAVKEYVDGTYVQEKQTADANVIIAEENLKSAQNLLEHNERMYHKGYINRLQLETNQFAVERSKLELDAMKTTRQVLVEYTKPKMQKELESIREAAEANVRAFRAAADLEKSKLDRLNEQLEKCIIRAPQGGLVIYANDRSRRSEATIIEEGSSVRQYQSIIQLPDLKRMQVKTMVHETKISKVRPNMPAIVKIRGIEFPGQVINVKSQPEPTNWFAADVKEYAVTVAIESSSINLKPGMTAEVEIMVREIPDALQLPVLGVAEEGTEIACYVKTPAGYERRVVTIGARNPSFLEIEEGVDEGEEVILNPRLAVAEAQRRAEQFGRRPAGDTKAKPPAAQTAEKKATPAKDQPEKPPAEVAVDRSRPDATKDGAAPDPNENVVPAGGGDAPNPKTVADPKSSS